MKRTALAFGVIVALATFGAPRPAAAADEEKEEIIGDATSYWKYLLENGAKRTEGWEDEKAPPAYKDWLMNTPMSLNTALTEKRLDLANSWFDDDRSKKALAKFGDDPRLQATLAEVQRAREEAGGKVLAFANAELDEAERAGPKDEFDNTRGKVEELINYLGVNTKGCAAHERTLARAQGLLKRWETEEAGAAAALAATTAKMKAAAGEMWPGFAAKWKDAAKCDPAACLADAGAWKGKTVRLERCRSLLGGSYWEDSYDFIGEVNGTPVAAKLDKGVVAALAEIAKRTGVQFDTIQVALEDIVGVVEGTCKVERRYWSNVTETSYRSGSVDAPLLRIVAFKGGPFAVAVGQGTSADKLPGVSPIAVKEGGPR